MAIRLTFDVIGSTCGDLLRFADAVRAAGAQPEQPLEQSSGPNRIDVLVHDGRGPGGYPYPGPVPGEFPFPWPGPQPHPNMPPPPLRRAGGPIQHGPFVPPSFGTHHVPRWERESGAFIGVNWGNRSRHTDVRIETIDRWAAALDTVLGSAGVDEAVKASLRDLREAFSDQDTTPGYQGGS